MSDHGKKPVTYEELQAATQDPVNFAFAKLQERSTGYCLDGDDKPCFEIKDDPTKQIHRLVDDQGRPTQRARSHLRSLYRYETGEKLHLDNVQAQGQAEKATLFTAINFFSRRLGELEQQFEKVGLDVVLSHRDSGSWVRITRRDRAFQPDPSILVTAADGQEPSSSGPSSGSNSNSGKALETTDDKIEIEKPKTEKVA